MQSLAKSKGGKCLSKKYKNVNSKLIWECSSKHTWKATPASIKSGNWCPKCAANKGKQTIKNMQFLAEQNGGTCLSKKFTNVKTKLLWRCAKNHTWRAKPTNIKAGKWCPKCSESISEKICRLYFEMIFKKPFPKAKPEWLVSPKTNTLLELDGFCEALNLAFEHNGRHHYESFVYGKCNNLENVQYNDKIKVELCKQRGITLIVIPQLFKKSSLADINTMLMKHNIKLPKRIENIDIVELKRKALLI